MIFTLFCVFTLGQDTVTKSFKLNQASLSALNAEASYAADGELLADYTERSFAGESKQFKLDVYNFEDLAGTRNSLCRQRFPKFKKHSVTSEVR